MKFRLDAQGNGMIYTYDPNGRQLTAKRSDNTGLLTSVYDCAGQRVQTSGDSVVRQMIYDVFGQLVEDYRADPSGTAQMTGAERENIYRGGQLLAVYESDLCYKSIGNFVADFYVGAFGAGATTTYATDIATWTVTLTKAQAQSTGALIGAAQQMGISVFSSSAYTSLGTTDNQYVNDLYESYLQRNPAGDPGGVAFWTGQVAVNGRTQVRLAFALSGEFGEKVVKLCPGTSGSTSTSANLKYVLSDTQGSARALMENNSTSSIILSRHDYLPYGEDISAGVGSRTTGQKYSITDEVRQRFGMTERDESSGLDHTLFRKHDSFAGRWTSPDPYQGSITVGNPQTLNRYAYVNNDPVNLTDPTGLFTNCGQNGLPPCESPRDPNPFPSPTSSDGPIAMPIEPFGREPEGGGFTMEPIAQRKLDPNHPECLALKRKIENLVKDILHRADDILRNPFNLPETAPGPRKESVQGHREILNEQVSNWQRRVDQYNDKCGGGGSGSQPQGSPVTPPVIVPAPRTNPGPRMVPGPVLIPRFFLIPLIMMDPCLVYPHLCHQPNA
jgi:RHS repeat-associated protein